MCVTRLRACMVALAAALGASALCSVSAAAAEFYAGKSVDLLIGAPPGGGYDIYGRTVARHIARHIPGHPNIVPKNMPGVGSARAAGFLSKVAPHDGTVIANIMPGAVIGPLLDPSMEKMFNPTAVQYIGNVNNGVRVCVSSGRSKVKTFDDARKIKVKFGGGQKNDSTHDYALMHTHTTGAIWYVVLGYKGTNYLSLAIERGEIDGICGFDWASLKAQHPDWVRYKAVNVLIQDAIEPNEELTKLGVPHIMKYVTSETNRKVVEFILSQQVFQRSFIAPPGTPPDHLAILRKAFDETMTDPEFLADAKKMRIDVAPLSGARVQQVVHDLYAAPPDVVDLARRAISP
jgi:tripartite-type tricarboxylate transporter receptor subunit TctC